MKNNLQYKNDLYDFQKDILQKVLYLNNLMPGNSLNPKQKDYSYFPIIDRNRDLDYVNELFLKKYLKKDNPIQIIPFMKNIFIYDPLQNYNFIPIYNINTSFTNEQEYSF